MGQEEYVFEEAPAKKSAVGGALKFIWNNQTKEFCGRDGASWGKVSLFYAVFYLGLGSFFIGMLAVFFQLMPKDVPTYYGDDSVMNTRGYKTNPGLGFRPQIDVEDSLIYYNPAVSQNEEDGHLKYVNNLKVFLNAKYPDETIDLLDALDCQANVSYAEELKNGKYCKFDYKKIFADSECTEEKNFGYTTNSPCVLVKLNKIVSWEPKIESGSGVVSIDCHGETAGDKDNINGVTYYSEGGVSNVNGKLQTKYYPFFAQKGYKAPFVWAKFDVKTDTLVNVECTAKADNIDYDRLNKRGLTKFTLFVSSAGN